MKISDKKVKEALSGENYVTDDDIKKAEEFAERNGVSFLDYLFSEKLITKDLLGQAVAESFKMTYADLNSIIPDTEQVKKYLKELLLSKKTIFLNQVS